MAREKISSSIKEVDVVGPFLGIRRMLPINWTESVLENYTMEPQLTVNAVKAVLVNQVFGTSSKDVPRCIIGSHPCEVGTTWTTASY